MPTFDPEIDIQDLSVAYPILLFPVRIETRFDPTKEALLIRVYPDEIVAEVHEPLTQAEVDAGHAYWTEGWNPAHELDAWRRLVARYRTPRAARIVRETTPDNIEDRGSDPEPSWSSATVVSPPEHIATASLLPDYWVAIATRGAVTRQAVGSLIDNPLSLTHRRDLEEGDPNLVDYEGLLIDEDLAWTIDFSRALQAGMGLSMQLEPEDFELGFERLIVVGFNKTLSPGVAAARVAELFENHRESRGLALIPQGTPTNSSAEGESGYPPSDDPDHTFAIERGVSLLAEDSDGDLLERALGLPNPLPGTTEARAFDHVEGAGRVEQVRARAMNEALWPCTGGYFLDQLMHPAIDATDLADARAHFAEFVRGRGPLPALRVGRTPYGILPVTPIPALGRGPSDTFGDDLRHLVAMWFAVFKGLADGAARIGKTPLDPDADLLAILQQDASCREVRLREVVGPAYVKAVLQLLGVASTVDDQVRATFTSAILTAAGLGSTSPRIAGLTFADQALRVSRPMVTSAPLSETVPLQPNYIDAIRTLSVADLRTIDDPAHESTAHGSPLLYHLLRQAALVEYRKLMMSAVIPFVDTPAWQETYKREVELVHIAPNTGPYKTPWDWFAEVDEDVTGSQVLTIGEWLLAGGSAAPQQSAAAFRAVLQVLASVPTAELDRLAAETLDTWSHRLDPWMTSIASRQLQAMRAANAEGVYIGGFGFVENLKPRPPREVTPGGFIHAPSALHAAAAAILRSAYLTRPAAARSDVAIELTSDRVRRALHLLDGVRQGQPAGAVLGYRLERALHDAGLDRYIAPLRKRYPIGNDPAQPPAGPQERVAARNVINGLALHDAAIGAAGIDWSRLPEVDQNDWGAVGACLRLLDDEVDAAADLLLSESVFQAVQGNIERTGANLATLAGGGAVPTPDVVKIPRGGAGVTHRVAIVLGAPPQNVSSGWASAPATPRHQAEPRLDAWAGILLGDPAAVRCRVSYPDPQDPEERTEEEVSLADLGLRPLDVLAIAQRTDALAGSELEARVLVHARATFQDLSEPAEVLFDRPDDPAWPLTVLSFPEACELARVVAELVGGARPLRPDDLVVPGAASEAAWDGADLEQRVGSALAQLESVRDDLATALADAQSPTPPSSLDDLRAALWAATRFGVPGSVPAPLLGDDEDARAALIEQGLAVLGELERRVTSATALVPEPLPQPPDPQPAIDPDDYLEPLRVVFGPGMSFLPAFEPDNRAELETALGDSPVTDPRTTRLWFLEIAARVRPSLDRLRLALLASEAVVPGFAGFEVAQLPHVPGMPWVGMEYDREQPPPRGVVSLALHRPDGFDGQAPWAGLLVDDWVEIIPADKQLTSYAVHHDAPGAEAPQCLVLALPDPSRGQGWSFSDLVAIVNQTLDTARIRAIDGDQLGAFSLLVPCIYLAANVADETIASALGDHRIQDTVVLAPE